MFVLGSFLSLKKCGRNCFVTVRVFILLWLDY
jgi:hypothetical protein